MSDSLNGGEIAFKSKEIKGDFKGGDSEWLSFNRVKLSVSGLNFLTEDLRGFSECEILNWSIL